MINDDDMNTILEKSTFSQLLSAVQLADVFLCFQSLSGVSVSNRWSSTCSRRRSYTQDKQFGNDEY